MINRTLNRETPAWYVCQLTIGQRDRVKRSFALSRLGHLPSPRGVSCSRTRRTLLLEWWFVSAVRLLWGRRAIVESLARAAPVGSVGASGRRAFS